jgi:putative membrane protein
VILHEEVEAIIRASSSANLIRSLAAVYAIIWIAAAIAPLDRGDWLLENLLVFIFVPVLALSYRRFAFSLLSYALIFVFLCLHAYAAHYTYSFTPLGFWLQETLGQTRNHYDRIAHFAFGLLLTYPMLELGRRVLGLRGGFGYALPGLVALGFSGGYEIVEWWAARSVDPELGTAFLGTQGDDWDSQKDMSLALAGAVICLALSAAVGAARARTRTS